MKRFSTIVRILYAVAFVVAMGLNVTTELDMVPIVGWRLDAPAASAIYWHSLLVIDPAVAALLLVRPKMGLLIAGIVLLTNVGHNTWFVYAFKEKSDWVYWASVGLLCLYFVVIVPAWRGVRPRDPAPEKAEQGARANAHVGHASC